MEKPGRNWRAKYLTREMFDTFLHNDFKHLKDKVNLSLWVSITILTAVLAKLAIDFFWG